MIREEYWLTRRWRKKVNLEIPALEKQLRCLQTSDKKCLKQQKRKTLKDTKETVLAQPRLFHYTPLQSSLQHEKRGHMSENIQKICNQELQQEYLPYFWHGYFSYYCAHYGNVLQTKMVVWSLIMLPKIFINTLFVCVFICLFAYVDWEYSHQPNRTDMVKTWAVNFNGTKDCLKRSGLHLQARFFITQEEQALLHLVHVEIHFIKLGEVFSFFL